MNIKYEPEGRRTGRIGDHATVEATEAFLAHRKLLFTVAYEMLGSVADTDDVLQETWLRWVGIDAAHADDLRAYLVRITTRQALDRLRSMKRRRESYVGSWLPEPLLTTPDVAADVELSESVSMTLMLVLETLTPTERAVFVLREAFGIGYDEIAAAVDKTPSAVRQIAHRARRHVEARRPRRTVSARQAEVTLTAFQQALENRDLQGLIDVLASDVVAISDGGGIKQATPGPLSAPTRWPDSSSAASLNGASRSLSSRPRSTVARPWLCTSTGNSTASSHCASSTPSSPASTTSATRRS